MERSTEHISGGSDTSGDKTVGNAVFAHHGAEVDAVGHHLDSLLKLKTFGFALFIELVGIFLQQRRSHVIKRFELALGDACFGTGFGDFGFSSENDDLGADFFIHSLVGSDNNAGVLTFGQNDGASHSAGALGKLFNCRHFVSPFIEKIVLKKQCI